MKFTVEWLKEYYDFNTDNFHDRLVSRGFEIEKEKNSFNLDHFKLVKIIAINKHPNADKLNICSVACKDDYKHNVVCGADNLYVGMITLLATVGALIPQTKSILQKAVIRDVESSGMLCSAEEMCLGSSDGILDLDVNLSDNLYDLFNDGSIFDIEVTANRKDVLNVFGISREISSGFRAKETNIMKSGSYEFKNKKYNIESCDGVIIANMSFVKNLQNKTPLFILKRLSSIDVKISENIIENIANYIFHSFGYNININNDKNIDNELKYENIININENKNLFVKVFAFNANFDNSLKYSDSSSLKIAMKNILDLLEKYAGYKFEYGFEDISMNEEKSIQLFYNEVIDISGHNYSKNEVYDALNKLDFQVIERYDEFIKVIIPTWRLNDIQDSSCLIEEIIRYHGLNKISQVDLDSGDIKYNISKDLIKKNFWVQKGLYEVFNNSFMEKKDEILFSDSIAVNNPMTSKQSFLRPSLIPNLLHLASKYSRYNWQCDGIFEIGNVFFNSGDSIDQKSNLACVWMNKLQTLNSVKKDFFSCKKDVEDFLTFSKFKYDEHKNIDNGCSWLKNNNQICTLTEITPKLKKHFKIKSEIFIFELDLSSVLYEQDKKSYEISMHNVVFKDLSFNFPKNLSVGEILSYIKNNFDKKIDVKIFDIHPNYNLSEEKSVGIRLIWDKLEKTQTSDELEQKSKELIDLVKNKGVEYAG